MTTVAPGLMHVMPVSALAVAPTTLKPAVKTTTLLEPGRTLRDAYHNILDDLDDDKDLTFALIQHACARQFRRHPDRERADRERRPDTPRNGPEPYEKYTRQGAQDGGPADYLCNYLDHHGVKSEKVLKRSGDDPASVNALYVVSTQFWPQLRTVRSDRFRR